MGIVFLKLGDMKDGFVPGDKLVLGDVTDGVASFPAEVS